MDSINLSRQMNKKELFFVLAESEQITVGDEQEHWAKSK